MVSKHASVMHSPGGRVASGGLLGTILVPASVILGGLLAIVLVWMAALRHAEMERTDVHRNAHTTAANLALAFEAHVVRTIDAIDQAMLTLRDVHRRHPDEFPSQAEALRAGFLSEYVIRIALADAAGRIVDLRPGPTPVDVSIADREHFAVHRERQDDELYIARPIVGRVSNKWEINLTRPLRDADGGLAGVIGIAVDPEYFTNLYRSIDIGSQGAIALIGLDRAVRAFGAQRNDPQLTLTTRIGADRPFLYREAPPAGFYRFFSGEAGVERLVAYRRLEKYPLAVTVLLAVPDFEAPALLIRRALFVGASVVSVLTLALSLLLAWHVRRQYLEQDHLRLASQRVDEARRAAEQASQAKSVFLANMSHELRTPLNAIIGFADLMADAPGAGSDAGPQREYAVHIATAGRHLLAVINDLLDLSRIEAGRLEIEARPVDLAAVVAMAADMLRPRASQKNVALDVDLPDDLPAIRGDAQRLSQVVVNVLGNAVKFTPAGGRIAVAITRPAEGGLAVRIADTGIGIPPELLGRLFQPFSSLATAEVRSHEGTGLGLWISQGLVEAHGGTIAIESAVGRGTVITIRLPEARVIADH